MRSAKFDVIGKRMIGGFEAWRLRNVALIRGIEDATVELWLLPDHDFVLVEFSVEYGSPKAAYEQIRDVEIELHDGIWVMGKAKS